MSALAPRGDPRPLAYRTRSREDVSAAVLAGLRAGGRRLDGRASDDPTLALVDAWATVADIIGFYQDRIAAEGYLPTAIEPESLLALGALTDYRPRPGLAASTWLAYRLVPDPRDEAVVLPGQLLVQSVPRTGETAQTFETVEEFVVRPSWDRLPVRTTASLWTAGGPGFVEDVPAVRLAGTAARVVAGDVLLLQPGEGSAQEPVPGRVGNVTPDPAASVTTVALRDARREAVPADRSPTDVLGALSALVPALVPPAPRPPRPIPYPDPPVTAATECLPSMHPWSGPPAPTAPPAAQDPASMPSDAAPAAEPAPDVGMVARVLTATHPELATGLYPALAATRIDAPAVMPGFGISTVARMRVRAAPLGARPVPGDDAGAAGAIGDTRALLVRAFVVYDDGLDPLRERPTGPPTVRLLEVSLHDPQGTALAGPDPTADPPAPWTLSWSPAGEATVTVTVGLDGTLVTLSRDDVRAAPFDPRSAPAYRTVLGPASATVTWALAPGRGIAGTLTVKMVERLPLGNDSDDDPVRRTLELDAVHDDVVPGSWVVVERCGDAAVNPWTYPVVARVLGVGTVPGARGTPARPVTRLELDRPWIGPRVRDASALAELVVHAAPEPLEALGPADTSVVGGTSIELDQLIPGLEAGRPLIVTGDRADLPGGVTLPAAEIAHVAAVRQEVRPGGDTPRTTLALEHSLAHAYRRSTVVVHGNVVAAHHGETVTETLTATSQAADDPAHPRFTLTRAPVLDDPDPDDGVRSTLRVTVDGRTWSAVSRFGHPAPPRSYLTGTDATGRTVLTFSERPPRPGSTVVATYRSAAPGAGNVAAGTLTQPLSRPLAVAGVTNPLAASGGAPADGADVVRTRAPVGLQALGRVVSAADAADFALAQPGVGKASARLGSDGRRRTLELTLAGTEPVPLGEGSALCAAVAAAVREAGDLALPVVVRSAPVLLVVLEAEVTHDGTLAWGTVRADVTARLRTALAYSQRALGEDVVLSDIVAVALRAEGVRAMQVLKVGLLDVDAAPEVLARLGDTVPVHEVPDGRLRVGRVLGGPQRIAYVGVDDVTVHLTEGKL